MSYTCNWCRATVNRLWEIPSGQKRETSEWVCRDCHGCYFDDDCDHTEKKIGEQRTI